jgi:hypothetical protein
MIFVAVPHDSQRYDTVGDYQEEGNTIFFSISRMHDDRYEQLVAIHELVEKILVTARGIPDRAIDQFDMAYEAARTPDNDDEPGNDPAAPYHKEHLFATKVERMLADELGLDWDVYDAAVLGLSK